MIPFNLIASTRATPFTQRHAKTRENFPTKTLQNFTQFPFIDSTFHHISCFSLDLFSSNTAHSKRKALVEMNPPFTTDEDQEMETQPI